MKCVVYTSITNNHDSLKPVCAACMREANFVVYSDVEFDSGNWQWRRACSTYEDPRRNSKEHKIYPVDLFREYDYSVWVDGSVVIKSPSSLTTLLETALGRHDLAAFRHQRRTC